MGYLKEQFMALEKEYPGVKLIENRIMIRATIFPPFMWQETISKAMILDGYKDL